MSVQIDIRDRVATVVLHRPDRRNAVERATADALHEAIVSVEQNEGVHVGVLWGAGGTFCAGADLQAFASGAPNHLAAEGPAPMGPSRLVTQKPWIAAIAGHAVAGGLELALWCDLRVAEQDAVLGVFCRRWGVPLIDGGTVRLPRLIGEGRALDLILTGRAVSADEALSMGLVSRVVPLGECRAAAEKLAAEIAAHPQRCLRADRRSVLEQHALPLDEALRNEFRSASPDVLQEALDGATAFAAGSGRHGSRREG
jgi:enoyl-CoA hydratase